MLTVMVGCDTSQSQSSDSETDDKSIELLSDTLKQHLVTQDSLYNELVSKVDTLTSKLNKIEQNEELKQNEPSIIWDILPLMLGAVALFAAVVLWFCSKHDLKRIEEMDNKLKNQDNVINNLKGQNKSHSYSPQNQTNQSVISEIKNKLSNLEYRINGLERSNAPIVKTSPVVAKAESYPSKLYANINSSDYFTNVVQSRQDTCVFEITLKTQTEGEFDIISLDKIKQRNDWEEVVDYVGDCTINEAKSFKTIQKGKCLKSQEYTWKVVSKLKIKISK